MRKDEGGRMKEDGCKRNDELVQIKPDESIWLEPFTATIRIHVITAAIIISWVPLASRSIAPSLCGP